MPEATYERDEEYSDESINVNFCCSWSTSDLLDQSTVLNVVIPDGTVFTSDRAEWLRKGRLEQLIDRIRQVDAGTSAAFVRSPSVRRPRRNFDEENLRAIASPFRPPAE